MNWCALLSLFLLLTLAACQTSPVIGHDPDIVFRDKLVRVSVPAALLMPCAVSRLPKDGDTWEDVFQIMKAKDLEQKTCNERFNTIRTWQEEGE